jgi:MoxR-like ATPase
MTELKWKPNLGANPVTWLLEQAAALGEGQTCQVHLDHHGSWPETEHLVNQKMLFAIASALGAGKPLLIRGEPGSGKSHLARAAAEVLDRHFFSYVVQPQTEYQDLLWTFDHTKRLATAQLMAASDEKTITKILGNKGKSDFASLFEPTTFISPGPLWYAFDWDGVNKGCFSHDYKPEPRQGKDQGLVLLIDEIDKAEISLSNGLLEVLGNGSFKVPHLEQAIGADQINKPLVIITSNSVRELPSALLRRCVILDIVLPEEEALINHLVAIGQAQFGRELLSEELMKKAAEKIIEDRRGAVEAAAKSGQAEFIDLLNVLKEVDVVEDRIEYVERLAGFFAKNKANKAHQ